MLKLDHRIIILYLISLLLSGPSILPAENAAVFHTLNLAGDIQFNLNRNEFHNYWRPGKGLGVEIETTYYVGHLIAGSQIISYLGRSDYPAFKGLFVYAGWGLAKPLGRNSRVSSAILLGNELMLFEFGPGEVRESELQMGLSVKATTSLNGRLAAHVTYSRLLLLTHRRIVRDFVGLGLDYTMKTPQWLQNLLR